MYDGYQVTSADHTQFQALAPASKRVSWCTIELDAAATGPCQIFGKSQTLAYVLASPGDSYVIWSPASLHLGIDLAEVYVKPNANGEKVNVSFVL